VIIADVQPPGSAYFSAASEIALEMAGFLCDNGFNTPPGKKEQHMDQDDNKDNLPQEPDTDPPVQPSVPGRHSKLIQALTAVFIALGTFVLLFLSGFDLARGLVVERTEIYWKYGWIAFIGISLLVVHGLERKKKFRFKTWWLAFLITAGACLAVMIIIYFTGIIKIH
jgi:hypothetical protein